VIVCRSTSIHKPLQVLVKVVYKLYFASQIMCILCAQKTLNRSHNYILVEIFNAHTFLGFTSNVNGHNILENISDSVSNSLKYNKVKGSHTYSI